MKSSEKLSLIEEKKTLKIAAGKISQGKHNKKKFKENEF